jgi:hypothetical protein
MSLEVSAELSLVLLSVELGWLGLLLVASTLEVVVTLRKVSTSSVVVVVSGVEVLLRITHLGLLWKHHGEATEHGLIDSSSRVC